MGEWNLSAMQTFTTVTLLIYIGFDYYESKQIKDEREELIRLKAHDIVQKSVIVALLLLIIINVFIFEMAAIHVILVIIIANLYVEMLAKLYLRTRL